MFEVHDSLINQYMYGDCGLLAYELAGLNPGWSTLVAGETTRREYDDGEVYYDPGCMVHVWAVRPDGMLVDIRGVHHPDTATTCLTHPSYSLHSYTDREDLDEQWFIVASDPVGDENASEVASWVMEQWGNHPEKMVATVITDEDYYADDYADEDY